MTFKVTLQPGGNTYETNAGESILTSGLHAGYHLPYSCRSGVCQSCRCRVIAGEVFSVGTNYADHLAEMGGGMEKVAGRAPFFYMKPRSTALTGPGQTVHIPPGCSNFDWEVEVVVVFGQGGRNIPLESALDCVAGYTLGIDFTSRDQFEAPHIPFKFDMVLGKCQDRTAPVGPAIVPKEFVDGENLNFRLSVNGIPKQDASTANMIYSLAEQISGISKAVRIEAGDILFTGSPAGVGAPRGERLKIGDKVVVEADVIGRMEVVIQPPLNASTTQS
jgi:2-keto-4-pentenoate hydratase/2-oxohepta-3-ene-1,7-dioic acid hydratase in catechol pathway